MSIRRHLVKPDMRLWNKMRQKMGNTKMTREAWFEVRIIEVQETGCVCSWNGNRPSWRPWRYIEKLYRQRPEATT